jgi:hypothetical protein
MPRRQSGRVYIYTLREAQGIHGGRREEEHSGRCVRGY